MYIDSIHRGHTLRITAVIAGLTILLLSGAASAKTLTVNASGGADYTRIQDAINNVSNGDTILVESGTYFENVNVTKQLILKGIDTGGGKPIVNAGGNGNAITLSVGNSMLEGFTAVNSWPYVSGIYMNSDYNIIKNNTVSGNYRGIQLDSSSNNNITGNNVSGNEEGISLFSSSNNTLSGNNAFNNFQGIFLGISNNNTLSGNNASNNYNFAYGDGYGIYLGSSSNNKLINNVMIENNYNFGLSGWQDSDFDNQIDTSNLVDGRPIYYLKKVANIIYGPSINAGTFYCISCVNVTIKDMSLNNNGAGITFWNTSHSKIQNVSVSNNNVYGIFLGYSSNNNITGNNVSNNNEGIYLSDYSNNNTLSGNNAFNNFQGIILGFSINNNTLSGNNASYNEDVGIFLLYDSNNNIIYNNFFNNINNIYINTNSVNKWNITRANGTNIIGGSYLGGNVWANPSSTGFSQTCTDGDNDGICDSPYVFDVRWGSNNTDYLPLVYTLPTVNINFSGILVVNQSTKDILSVDYWNFNASDPYNISITRMKDSSVVYTNNGTLKGVHKETIPINWIPQGRESYLVEAKGSTIVSNKTITVYDSEPITPIPELSTIALTSAGLLGLIGLARLRRKDEDQ